MKEEMQLMCTQLATFPGPAQLSVAISTEKQETVWYHFLHEWRQDRKDGRKGLIVRGCTGPRTSKRANVASNLLHVSSERRVIVTYTERWACSQLNIMLNATCKFSSFSVYVMLTWEKIPALPAFPYCKWRKPGWGLGTRLYTMTRSVTTN